MPSDRLLAKLVTKNQQTQQAPSNDGNTPRAEASDTKPLSNAPSPSVHCNVKRTSSGQDTHNAQQTSSVKRLKIAAPPRAQPLAPGRTPPSPLPGETSDKVNPVIIEIEPHARWTAGVSPPMQAFNVFDLPADADAYINESPSELLNRTRRHFGRFAADFVHVTKLFGLNNFEESYQKLIEENTVLKNVQQQSKTRIEQLQSEIASFEKQRQSWETDRLKLNTDNKRLSQDKSNLSSRVTELFSKLTALEAEHQHAANKITALEHELNQVKSELIQADEESMNSLKEGYTACLDKFHAAGIDITGKTYQDYLNEITAKTSQTASNELAPEIASNVAQAHLYTIIKQEDDEMLAPHQELVEVPHPVEGPPLVEGPQPMEVAQTDSTNAADSQEVDEPQASRFTWMIENFSRLNTKKQYSDVFVVDGFKWRVLIFPKGNNVDHLSMYLDVADSSTLPYGWNRYAQFSLAVVNQIQPKYTLKKDTQHQFHARESDWGFTSFMSLSELYDPNKGYLVNDTCIIEADVAVRKGVDYCAYDPKKETGFVGLKNQGATGYMNSLLQTLYHIPYFRKAVYHMPTIDNMPSGSIPLALQSLFYKLQYNDTSVATKELTKSFGWDTNDSFMQHDVQELNIVLSEKLEDKMKGMVVEGTIQKLFEGHHMNYIECINVDFKSTRKESFYDLQLDVKNCRDVYDSFDKYVEVESLEGDNKYHAENHGLQDAKKGVLFIDFPPVLQLQLKRFEYDSMRDTMVKVNDRYEFPLELDLDRENGKYLSPDANRSVRNLYTLHSVLVHSGGPGGVHEGHYYAFIRPSLSDQWFKFDDERVTKEDMKKALEEQYGGEEELPQTYPGFSTAPFKFTKYSNAYMLVYIRESDKEKIICDVDEKDIAEHLRIRLKKEQEEKENKRKYKAQAHLYTIIKVARDKDLMEQIGKDIYFDLVDHDKVRSFRIQKHISFNSFKEEVAKEFGVPVEFQRFWIWAKRQNHTYRPDRPLTQQEEAQSVGQLREVSNKNHNAELKLFLEIETGKDQLPISPPDKSKEDILLFFKLYDPKKEELRYVGRLFVKSTGRPIEILTKLNEMAGFDADEEIELFEEVKFEPCVMCERLDKRASFRLSQIEDGDIICFQKYPQPQNEDEYKYPDVPSYLEYVKNRQIVHFRSLEKPKEDDFCLELSKLHTYDDVVERVAQKLGLEDLLKIRLTPHNCYSQQPKHHPIKYRVAEHLLDMLVHFNQISDILYYEVLDIPLPELQCLKTLKVAFHHATKDEVVIHNIRLPKQSNVGDVLNEIKTKVELSHSNAELRLLEVFYHKIYKIFPLNENIENINDQYWTLRAEEIPEEEKNLGPHDRLIHVYHFRKETAQNQMQVQNFGEPFFLVIHEGETLAEVKTRIQKKLQVPDEEFTKWKFAFLSLGRTEYLLDSDVVSSRFQVLLKPDFLCGAWEQYLGLEHSDTTTKRAFNANQN